jgi:ABC-type branched-subunit amino acid transport system substrate-binding protein
MIAPIHSRWLTAALCTLLSGCGPFFDDMAERRAAYAEAGEGPIVVAVVDDRSDEGYLDGVRLGAEQINSSDEGLLGRPIELLVRRGHDDLRKMLPTIRSIAANPTVTAILGHSTSAVAVPASITYDKARVLFMPPFATSQQLTLHGFDFVLRMLPDDKRMTAQIASLAGLFGYKRIAVLHDRSESSRAIAFLFEDAVRRFDIDIAFRGSFFASSKNYRELIGQLKGVDFDAIFLSTETRAGARMLRQLRGQGIDKPVLGSDALGAGPLIELAGDAGDRTIVPTVFSPETTNNSERQRFIRDYRDTYGKEPDQAAAQGYDSINILATIVERGGATEPRALATTAHFTGPMAGITGIYAYDPDGNIYGKSYRFKVLRFGRWWPLPGVTRPYLLAGFQDVLVQDVNAAQTPHLQQADTPEPRAAAQVPPPAPAMASTADPANWKQRDLQAGAQPATMEEALTLGDGESLTALTRGYRGITERDQAWLALAHEILEFDRLGLVISPSPAHDVALVGLARSVARKRGFEVEVCELPVQEPKPGGEALEASGATAEGMDSNAVASERIALEKAALRCYSRLARAVDSLFVVTDAGLSPSHLKRLNRALLHFGVSTFAFQETIEHDFGLTLALVSSGLDLQEPNVALRFNGVLNGLRVHELNQKLSHLPLVAVDLEAARSLGLFTDPRELTLISDVLDSSPPQPALSLAEETN